MRIGRVARHFAADADGFTAFARRRDGVGNQLQHRRVARVIQMHQAFIGAVYGQGVLNQIVGAYRQKIKKVEEALHLQGRCGDFYHGAHLHAAIALPLRVQLGAAVRELGKDLHDFFFAAKHRNQNLHHPMLRRPQQGFELGAEHGRLGQAPANSAQAQRRVFCGIAFSMGTAMAIQWFIGTNIQGADGDGQALHTEQRLFVGVVLLVLIGQLPAAPHE